MTYVWASTSATSARATWLTAEFSRDMHTEECRSSGRKGQDRDEACVQPCGPGAPHHEAEEVDRHQNGTCMRGVNLPSRTICEGELQSRPDLWGGWRFVGCGCRIDFLQQLMNSLLQFLRHTLFLSI